MFAVLLLLLVAYAILALAATALTAERGPRRDRGTPETAVCIQSQVDLAPADVEPDLIERQVAAS
jgi:hypothetical protein